ncbi:ATP-binding protein [Roseivirga sp. BDSF3-8]|uniref:ATP-binding protein n=1 Tax=Roseivirga sp. BDSF3-8 TaxID=3241598 RepID=UPI0035321D4D
MTDYSKFASIGAEPEASSMIETFRAIGYSVETALADIIDNSISAQAKNIWIDYEWAGADTVIAIADDGIGMNNEELIRAMRPGSFNPKANRSPTDLGRFGLGLKTASFSQCRKFCVYSKKKDYHSVYWTWDLDYVEEVKGWQLIQFCPHSLVADKYLDDLEAGTCVLWWDLDRLTKHTLSDSQSSKMKFMQTMDKVKKHLSMVFHRYIDKSVSIFFRGRKIESWDPYMIGCIGLQPRPRSIIDESVSVKPYILPHRTKLNPEEYEKGKGPRDSWTAHQGFYVYRNDRLLVCGDWLGMFKREVHYDLCRISIELPNNMDEEWQIDIKKSVARPPSRLKDTIRAIAADARNQAVDVYRHRGKVLQRSLGSSKSIYIWEELVKHGKRFYKINRDHPIIQNLLAENSNKSVIENVLCCIEETVPVPLITLSENENIQPQAEPFENDVKVITDLIYDFAKSLLDRGESLSQIKKIIIQIEPFDKYPEIIDSLC